MTQPARDSYGSSPEEPNSHTNGVSPTIVLGLPPRPRVSFPDLDGLRFLAFFVVFLQHGCYRLAAQYLPPRVAETLFLRGEEGVSFFFVLSGFLITYLLLVERASTGVIRIRRFYARRALRIWPLYYFLLLIYVLAFPLIQHHPTEARPWPFFVFLSNIELIRTHSLGISVSLCMGVLWSVAVEEQFYLVWPWAVKMTSGRTFQAVCLALIAISCWFRTSTAGTYAERHHTFSAVGYLAMGSLVASLMHGEGGSRTAKIPRSACVAGYLAGLVCFCFFPGARLALSAFYAFVVAEQCFAKHSFYKMSHCKAISRAGLYTYGLYLLHPLAILLVSKITSNAAALVAGSFVLSLLLAWSSYKFLEAPALRLKSRFAVVVRD